MLKVESQNNYLRKKMEISRHWIFLQVNWNNECKASMNDDSDDFLKTFPASISLLRHIFTNLKLDSNIIEEFTSCHNFK